MKMKKFLVQEIEFISIIEKLSSHELTKTSHLYNRFSGQTIKKAVEKFAPNYNNEAKERPGLVLLSVIMSAHRNYTKQVEPKINLIRKTNFKSFNDLKQNLINIHTFIHFYGAEEKDKFRILCILIDKIENLKNHYGTNNDYEVINKWAKDVDLDNLKNDIIAQIPGIGIATVQHLRMNFGVKTVKPDQRVMEVLNKEFQLKSQDAIMCIKAVEYISKVTGFDILALDQILVNYGSGYYVDKRDKGNQEKFSNKIYLKEAQFKTKNQNLKIIEKVKLAEKFYRTFEKTNPEIQDLFNNLISMVDNKGIINKATNTPDYRLVKKDNRTNFCLIKLSKKAINIHIQRNNIGIYSDKLVFNEIKEGRYNGTDWIGVKVTNERELNESFRLIMIIFDNS